MAKNKKINLKKTFNNKNAKTFVRVWKLSLKKYFVYILLVFVFLVVYSLANAGSLALIKNIVDKGFIEKDYSSLQMVGVAMIGLFLLKSVAYFFNTYLLNVASIKATIDLRNKVFQHLMKLDVDYYEKNNSGIIVTRVVNDAAAAGELLRQVFTVMLRNFFVVMSLVVVMFYQSPKLAVFTLIFFPGFFYLIRTLNKKMRKAYSGTMVKTEGIFSYLTQVFQNIPILKIYTRENYEIDKANTVFKDMAKIQKKTFRVQSISVPIIEALTGIVIACALFLGGYAISHNIITAGSFLVFFVALFAIYTPLKQFIGAIPNIQGLLISVERMFMIYDSIPTVKEDENAKDLVLDKGKVEFKNVSFKYETSNKNVLEDISFTISPNEVLALVGPSGSGKSTIVKLLARFYDVTSGEITIDSQNIKDISQHSLRSLMSMVTQDVFLFDDTIRNNIAYGSNLDPNKVSEEDIIEASKKADAYNFIMDMPEQFDTVIGERGTKLSGGQKQRLSIARAILKDAPILLLDEATSALDSESEKSVQKALTDLMHNRTTIVIAHRLSTITNANRILVIEKGKLIEQGTHQELIDLNGKYKILHALQFNSI